MPAILSSPSEIALWLSDEPWGTKLQSIIRPYEGDLTCYKVPLEVGKVQNDSPDFIKVRSSFLPIHPSQSVFPYDSFASSACDASSSDADD